MTEIRLILEDFLIDVIGFVAVQVDDLRAIRKHVPLPFAEACRRASRVERKEVPACFAQPVLDAQNDRIDAVPVFPKVARGIEQLLEHLIVRGELNADRLPCVFAPKPEGILKRLRGECGGDAQPRRVRRSGPCRSGTLQECERDIRDCPEWNAAFVHRGHGAAQCLAAWSGFVRE